MANTVENESFFGYEVPFVDRERVQRLIEKASKDPDQELRIHFVSSVFANVEEIAKALGDAETSLKERLARMQRAAQAIEDLAMIHGFEGIETIASNVQAVLASVDRRTQQELPEKLARKIRIALEAIQKIIELSDQLNERVLVDSTTSHMTELDRAKPIAEAREDETPVAEAPTSEASVGETEPTEPPPLGSEDALWTKLEQEGEEASEEDFPAELFGLETLGPGEGDEEPAVETGEQPLFDIREASELMELMTDEQEVDAEESSADRLEEGAAGDDAEPSMAEGAQESEVSRELFADVLAMEIRESVGALRKLVGNEGRLTVAEVDNAIFAVEGLRETAEKLRNSRVAELALALIDYLREKPKAGSLLSDSSRGLLEQAIQALEAYRKGSDDAAARLQFVRERLREETATVAEEADIFDDALLLELQKKLDNRDDREPQGLKGKIRKIFGI